MKRPPQDVSPNPSGRAKLHTSTDLAMLIAGLGTGALSVYMTASQAHATVSRRLQQRTSRAVPAFDRFDVETALDVLALRGLVSTEREEWEVSTARPQRYRWSRLATCDALERFASTSQRCENTRCDQRANGAPFCSERCRRAKYERERGRVTP